MKLTDLKIGTQLKIGFGIIITLIIFLGVISWRQTDKIAFQANEIYDHPLTVSRAIGELKTDIMAMRLEFRNFLLAKSDMERQEAILNSDDSEADAELQFQALSERYLGPMSDVENAHIAFLNWEKARMDIMQIGKSENISDALVRLEKTGDIGIEREQLLSWVKRIDDFARSKASDLRLNATNLDKLLNRQLALLVIGILGLSILIIYLLNRNIRRPVVELARVTNLFREGNLHSRSKYRSSNEFGQLSNSFNHLADTIETEMTQNNQAAKLAKVMLSEDDAHKFSHSLLNSLLEQTNSQMGAVYFLNEEKTEFERFECLGMDEDGCKPFSAVNFEGEFGLALSTQKIQHIANIPEDTHFSFRTVAGKFAPREIVTIPIVSGNETVAVISLATIKNFSNSNIRLLNTILSTLSARMGGILTYRKMIDFSLQLEHQNTKLENQREELHVLNKELTRRSEIVSAANSELEAQKRELSAQASELTEQNIELEMQKKQLDESNRLKTSFLSNMSHELRTPLNSVIALSGVLNRRLSGKLPDEEYSYLNVIERNGKQLLLLINDILDLSRIEAGREDVEINRFSIRELVNEVVEMIEPQANQKYISLHYITEKELSPIKSDYVKCRHILQNIVANAVKFTEEGGVEIIAEEMAESIRITVSDTGIGIDREHVPHIFDEFRQADGSNSRKYGGTGLGLAIAKKYAEMLDGRIEVESTPGKGSKFMLILPIQYRSVQTKIDDYVDPINQSKSSFNGVMNASGKTILLVEDTDAVIIQMKEILVQQGYKIMVARNGNEALNQIEHQIPDAMILDLMMPEVDGFEVLKRIRNEEKTDHLPVIILTAKYVTKEELAFLKSNSIYQLIQKGDINKDQLLNTVAQMMFPEAVKVDVPATKPSRIPISGTPLVLVVEDNPDNMTTIKALLDGKCQIIEAEDGRTGVEMALKHQPHLILMDIALPGMNGIEALIEIRNDEKLEFVPIIAVSASAMKGDREDFIALGFDSYISKPIDNKAFQTIIAEYLN